MAKQRYVNTKIWRDSYIENLDPSEKLLFLYLLTNPDTNISGIYEIPIKIIAVDIGFDKEMTKKILDRFHKDNKIKYKDGWIAIKNFTLHQSISPKIKIGIETELNNAPVDMVLWVTLDENIEYTRTIEEVSHLIKSNIIESNTNTNPNEPIGSAPKKDTKKDITPSKSINIPIALNNNVFKNKWKEWDSYRKKAKWKWDIGMAQKQVDWLEQYGFMNASKMLEQSMMNGWQGVFELKNKSSGKGNSEDNRSSAIDELIKEGVLK